MKKSTLSTVISVLETVEFEGKEAIMGELQTEASRGAAEKAMKDMEYEAAWDAIHEVLISTKQPLTIAEIYNEAKGALPEGFSKGKVQYGLLHQWEKDVVKIEGSPNTYRLK